ncbi:hypothetical protein SAMD00019534_081380, partial [Acytostelium subglobosum LB1]|uniref:hypothetical protein n=1 Tax=Acytostelium subglobosum LB1 TaxID=1410327 RepID=UPI0006452137
HVDNVVKVYYMQAPIFEAMYGNLFGELGGFHSALGFFDQTTGMNYTAEYDAYYEVLNGSFPNIVEVNGTKELLWCNKGTLCTFPSVNLTYWDPSIFPSASLTYLSTINGATFNKFSQWMLSYNDTNPNYQTWDVWDSFGDNLYLQSSTCDDFVVAGVEYLYSLGSTFECDTVFKRDYINIYSSKPVMISFKEEKEDILKFFEVFHFTKGESFIDVIKQVMSIFDLKKYFYDDKGNYYRLDLNFPYVDIKYEFAKLPGCPQPSNG